MSEYTSGLEVVFANIDRHNSELNARIDQELQAAGLECQGLAKKAAPVGTPESAGIKGYIGGRLRSSIQYQRKGPRECKVWTTLYYAPFVEYGTVRMKARPFLFPAFEIARRHLMDELKSIGV